MPRALAIAIAALIAFGAAWGIGSMTSSSEAGEPEVERAQKVDVPTQELVAYKAGAAIPSLKRERTARKRKATPSTGGGSSTQPADPGGSSTQPADPGGSSTQPADPVQPRVTPQPKQPTPPKRPDPCITDCGGGGDAGGGGSGGTE